VGDFEGSRPKKLAKETSSGAPLNSHIGEDLLAVSFGDAGRGVVLVAWTQELPGQETALGSVSAQGASNPASTVDGYGAGASTVDDAPKIWTAWYGLAQSVESEKTAISLREALSATRNTNRIDVVRAYWRLSATWARFAVHLEVLHQLRTIPIRTEDTARSQAFQAYVMLKLRRLEADLEQHSQQLGELTGIQFRGLALPIDQPLTGDYRTYFAEIFAKKNPPPRIRTIAYSLPVQCGYLRAQARAIRSAQDVTLALSDAYTAGRANYVDLLKAVFLLRDAQEEFVAETVRYNEWVAEYALGVTEPGLPTELVAKMLIGPGERREREAPEKNQASGTARLGSSDTPGLPQQIGSPINPGSSGNPAAHEERADSFPPAAAAGKSSQAQKVVPNPSRGQWPRGSDSRPASGASGAHAPGRAGWSPIPDSRASGSIAGADEGNGAECENTGIPPVWDQHRASSPQLESWTPEGSLPGVHPRNRGAISELERTARPLEISAPPNLEPDLVGQGFGEGNASRYSGPNPPAGAGIENRELRAFRPFSSRTSTAFTVGSEAADGSPRTQEEGDTAPLVAVESPQIASTGESENKDDRSTGRGEFSADVTDDANAPASIPAPNQPTLPESLRDATRNSTSDSATPWYVEKLTGDAEWRRYQHYPGLLVLPPARQAGELARLVFSPSEAPPKATESPLQGRSKAMTLLDCLAAAKGGDRLANVEAYWQLTKCLATISVVQQEINTLDQMASELLARRETPTGAQEMVKLRTRRLLAEAMLMKLNRERIELQDALAIQMGILPESEPWKLVTLPHTGKYDLDWERLPEGLRQSPAVQRAASTVRLAHDGVLCAVEVVIQADELRAWETKRWEQEGGSIDQWLAGVELETRGLREFIDSVIQYNLAIARYANAVIPRNRSAEEFTAALVISASR